MLIVLKSMRILFLLSKMRFLWVFSVTKEERLDFQLHHFPDIQQNAVILPLHQAGVLAQG